MSVAPYISSVPPQYLVIPGSATPYQHSQRPTITSNFEQLNSGMNANNSSTTRSTTATLVLGILIGLIVCGVPLAVISTLYISDKSQTSSSVEINSVSSGTNAAFNYTLPSQCTSYTINTDSTRNVGYSCNGCHCDNSLTSGWYRFTGSAGTDLVTSPVSTGFCGTSYPGWFNGTLPTTIGGIASGTVCVNVNGVLCQSTYSMTSIIVTSCNGYYVYYLRPMSYCSTRYCTA